MVGGEQKMKEVLDTTLREMESQGVVLLKITFGEPSSAIIMGNELQCTLPEALEMQVQGGKLIDISTMIAISTDAGKNWYFIDISGKDIQTMKKHCLI